MVYVVTLWGVTIKDKATGNAVEAPHVALVNAGDAGPAAAAYHALGAAWGIHGVDFDEETPFGPGNGVAFEVRPSRGLLGKLGRFRVSVEPVTAIDGPLLTVTTTGAPV